MSTPLLIHTARELRAHLRPLRAAGSQVAFVPTMGALHQGHQSLMEAARAKAEVVVVSIFVNPTQFGPGEDFERYPRTLDADREICAGAGVDVIFAPEVSEVYPGASLTTVRVSEMTDRLCGAGRPGHFEGVTTVVTKLFHLVEPTMAFFGRKDYQQLTVLRQMTRDLCWDIQIVGVPTVREHDGLALSSRNRYLSAEQRGKALCLSKALRAAVEEARRGVVDAGELLDCARALLPLDDPELRLEYLSLVHPDSLEALDALGSEGGVMLIALHVGDTRLIDNLHLACT